MSSLSNPRVFPALLCVLVFIHIGNVKEQVSQTIFSQLSLSWQEARAAITHLYRKIQSPAYLLIRDYCAFHSTELNFGCRLWKFQDSPQNYWKSGLFEEEEQNRTRSLLSNAAGCHCVIMCSLADTNHWKKPISVILKIQ